MREDLMPTLFDPPKPKPAPPRAPVRIVAMPSPCYVCGAKESSPTGGMRYSQRLRAYLCGETCDREAERASD